MKIWLTDQVSRVSILSNSNKNIKKNQMINIYKLFKNNQNTYILHRSNLQAPITINWLLTFCRLKSSDDELYEYTYNLLNKTTPA